VGSVDPRSCYGSISRSGQVGHRGLHEADLIRLWVVDISTVVATVFEPCTYMHLAPILTLLFDVLIN
jgi:hypothetical protein